MRVFIAKLEGGLFALNLEDSGTLADLQQLLYDREGVPPCRQRLIFDRQELGANLSVASYGLCEGSKIYLLQRFDTGLVIRSLGGATVCLTDEDLLGYDNYPVPIERLKVIIQLKTGLATAQQRLFFKGKELEDLRSLVDYNIRGGMTVLLGLRLRGGGHQL